MIRYRPKRHTMTASLKDEEKFDSIQEMLDATFARLEKAMMYIGHEKTIRPDKLIIDSIGKSNPAVGYRDEHKIILRREKDLCIGYCDLEETL